MSASTSRGWWKAPTRFLPWRELIPVLPPTELSTWASSVVGICTKPTPRRSTAAAKPARSPTTPPPKATTRSSRPTFSAISHSTACSSPAQPLVASPGSSSSTDDGDAGLGEAGAQRRQVQARDPALGQDGDTRAAEQRRDLGAGPRQQPGADADRVGARAERDRDGRLAHGAIPASARQSAGQSRSRAATAARIARAIASWLAPRRLSTMTSASA